jgi:hypothetical protein
MKVSKDYIKCFFTMLFLPAMLFSQTAYKSKQSGLWSDFNTWQRFNGTVWINATSGQVPSSADGAIAIVNSHIVTINSNVSIDQTTIDSGARVILSAGNLTINNGLGTDLIL